MAISEGGPLGSEPYFPTWTIMELSMVIRTLLGVNKHSYPTSNNRDS